MYSCMTLQVQLMVFIFWLPLQIIAEKENSTHSLSDIIPLIVCGLYFDL